MRYAVVKDGIVINLIEWDGQAPYIPPEGSTLLQDSECRAVIGEAAPQ